MAYLKAAIAMTLGVGISCHYWTISVSGWSCDYLKVAKIQNLISDGPFLIVKIVS